MDLTQGVPTLAQAGLNRHILVPQRWENPTLVRHRHGVMTASYVQAWEGRIQDRYGPEEDETEWKVRCRFEAPSSRSGAC